MNDLNKPEADAIVKPLEWIRLELLPLPESELDAMLLYWNPLTGVLQGEGSEMVLDWITQALKQGNVSSPTLSQFEITDPLRKPSELAAILAQHFWVLPQPVEAPGLVNFEVKNTLQ